MQKEEIKIVAICTGILCLLVLLGAQYIFEYYSNDTEKVETGTFNNEQTSSSTNDMIEEPTSNEEVIDSDYDTSSLNKINLADFLNVLDSEALNITLIGRKNCSHCVNFLPIVVEVNAEYNLNINYLDSSDINYNSEEYKALLQKDEFIHERFGYTPMIVISKNQDVVNGFVGEKTKSEFITYLKKYKVI